MGIECEILDDACYQYALQHSSVAETEALKGLRAASLEVPQGRMISAREQGQLLSMLIKLMNVKRAIEIGTFTGYGTLWMALALPDDGKMITCDINEKSPAIAAPFWQQAGVGNKIDLRIQQGLHLLEQLIDEGQQNKFDFAYLDADKQNYANYLIKLAELIRPNGLVVVDNVLWKGRVTHKEQDKRSAAINEFNAKIAADPQFESVMLLIADGMSLIRKKSPVTE